MGACAANLFVEVVIESSGTFFFYFCLEIGKERPRCVRSGHYKHTPNANSHLRIVRNFDMRFESELVFETCY